MNIDFQSEDFAKIYSVIWLVELGLSWRWLRIFFGSEVNGGYRDDYNFRIFNFSFIQQAVTFVWVALHLMILTTWFWKEALVIIVFLNHHHFIRERWKSLLRGMGAPGFMLYWMSASILLLSLGENVGEDAQTAIESLIVLDFALIMITAGIYKLKAGYRRGFGIEFGLVTRQWCYLHNVFRYLRPKSIVFRVLNELSWFLEIVGGLLMLTSSTRALGVAIIALSFAFLIPLIRLGVLCITVISCCLIVGSIDVNLSQVVQSVLENQLPTQEFVAILIVFMYIVGMISTRIIQMRNVFWHKSLPRSMQTFSEIFGNLFGITLWRVFTPDVTSFTVEMRLRNDNCADFSAPQDTELYSMWGKGRFSLVAEAIALTSLFTLRRYFPNARNLFELRLLRHAKSVARPDSGGVTYRYLEVVKRDADFCLVETARFDVTITSGQIVETVTPGSNIESPIGPSPVRPGFRLGSYEQGQKSSETFD